MHPVEGTIVILDLDRFEDYMKEHGIVDEYKPNIVTGTLTRLVEELLGKWRGVMVYGLDYQRGTEEAVIEVPYTNALELKDDLIRLAEAIASLGASITIVALTGYIMGIPARNQREAYSGYRRRAKRVLERFKKQGGGVVYIDGMIVWRLKPTGSS